MAVELDIDAILSKARNDAEKLAKANGTKLLDAPKAVEAAEKRPNSDFTQGGGFAEGDIIIFPKTREELDKFWIVEESNTKSVSLVLAVQRGAQLAGIRVYPTWFTNATHPCNDDCEEDTERWLTHEGEPAKIARETIGMVTDVFYRFIGATIRVTRVDKHQCKVLDSKNSVFGGTNPVYKFKVGFRKFYTFEFVERPTADTSTTEGK